MLVDKRYVDHAAQDGMIAKLLESTSFSPEMSFSFGAAEIPY